MAISSFLKSPVAKVSAINGSGRPLRGGGQGQGVLTPVPILWPEGSSRRQVWEALSLYQHLPL